MTEDLTRSFEVEDGAIAVLNPDGRVLRQAVPEGVQPSTFRNVLGAVEVCYNRNGTFPTPHQARAIWDRYPLKTFQQIFATDEFKEALDKRGISATPESGLNDRQMVALSLLSNPDDRRSVSAKLRDIGVPYTTFQNWMRQPLFAGLYRERVENVLQDLVPAAIIQLAANVESGSQKAIEFTLEMTNRYNPKAIEVENARTVVLKLLESIQRHASAEVRDKVLGDLDVILGNAQVTTSLKEIS